MATTVILLSIIINRFILNSLHSLITIALTCTVYIDTGMGDSNPIMLTLITSGPPFPRTWRILITQIECTSTFRADPGCLQFYTGVYGRLRSFNFDTNVGSQLSNQDYSICIRPERNFCSIQYAACPDTSK